MSCCLTTPNHYLNQCWRIITGVLWYSSQSDATKNAHEFNSLHIFERYTLNSPQGPRCSLCVCSQIAFPENFAYLNIKFDLQWRDNERNGIWNHRRLDCLLNCLFSRSKKTSKPHVTVLCAGNSTATGEFPAQKASNAENVSIWWRHHASKPTRKDLCKYDLDVVSLRDISLDIILKILS